MLEKTELNDAPPHRELPRMLEKTELNDAPSALEASTRSEPDAAVSQGATDAGDRVESDAAQAEPAEPAEPHASSSSAPEPVAAVSTNSLEPVARQPTDVDSSLPPRPSRTARSLSTTLGLAAALMIVLGGIVLFTRSRESEPDTTQAARSPDPQIAQGEASPRKPAPNEPTAPTPAAAKPAATEPAATETAATETAAPEPAVAEPVIADSMAPSAPPVPETEATADAADNAESPSPASPGGLVTVTIRTTPPGAIIYDEKQRLGKGTAQIVLKQGRKRGMMALLNLHHPLHFVVDGSQPTVDVTLERMDAGTIARATAAHERKAAKGSAKSSAKPARAAR